jgi:hypothetical protein
MSLYETHFNFVFQAKSFRGALGGCILRAFIDQQERHEAIQNSVDTQNRWVRSNIADALGFDWFVRDIETIAASLRTAASLQASSISLFQLLTLLQFAPVRTGEGEPTFFRAACNCNVIPFPRYLLVWARRGLTRKMN